MDQKFQTITINVPLLTTGQIHRLEITAGGTGTRHKHVQAFMPIDFVDGNGHRYTGNVNVQVQSLAEQQAARECKDGNGKKRKFNAAEWLAANPDQLEVE